MEIYGGDPKIIATRDEIQRCSHWLQQSLHHLQAARSEIELSVLIPGIEFFNLIGFFKLQFQLPPLESDIQRLIVACHTASESYFSTETRLAREISERYVKPATTLPWVFLMAVTPRERFALNPLVPITSALAVAGFSNKPSAAAVQSIRTAADLAPAAFAKPPWPFGAPSGQNPKDVSSLLGQIGTNLALLGVWSVSAGKARLVSSSETKSATNLTGHLQKLKHSYFNPISSIHIESYAKKGIGRNLVVYIPGTQSNALGGENPFDMKSNLEAATGRGLAASETAVKAALQELAAGAGDSVLFVGHSQGGLVASNIALSTNQYQTIGLISVGAPIAHQPLHVPTIALEHTNDLVPALTGETNPMLENWVTVQTEVQADSILTAHSVSSYLETAKHADATNNAGLQNIINQIAIGEHSGSKYVFEIYR